MAGGQESPRQKMIGMMYLVLTALLALNVSSTVLDKFIFINQSLERSVREASETNENTVRRIQSAVEESGNRDTDVAVLRKAQEIREKSKVVLKELDELKETFVEITGGRDDNGEIKGKTDYDRVGHYMMPEGGNNGEALKKTLNDFAKYLTESIGEEFEPIAKDANDHPVFRNDPNQRGKDFATLTFQSTPTPAGMASVSEMQTEVMSYEARALDILARKVGAGDLKFDQILPMVRPESKVVAAGAKYRAELFIAASSSGVTPTMKVDGRDITVTDGMGQVEFTASPGSYDKDGIAKKSFEAAISLTMPGGRDTVFKQTIEYMVAKPVIQIQSAAISALYLNCGNELQVDVPALGTAYNPTFRVTGGRAITGSQRGQVTIVPNAAKVDLSVSSGGNLIGTQSFQVRMIPQPEIKVMDRGREVDQKRGVQSMPRALQVTAAAEEGFRNLLPKDSRFRVAESEVTLVRAGRAILNNRMTGENLNLTQYASQARSGDALVIEVRRVQRMNFQDQVEDFNKYGPRIIQVRIN